MPRQLRAAKDRSIDQLGIRSSPLQDGLLPRSTRFCTPAPLPWCCRSSACASTCVSTSRCTVICTAEHVPDAACMHYGPGQNADVASMRMSSVPDESVPQGCARRGHLQRSATHGSSRRACHQPQSSPQTKAPSCTNADDAAVDQVIWAQPCCHTETILNGCIASCSAQHEGQHGLTGLSRSVGTCEGKNPQSIARLGSLRHSCHAIA